MYFSYKSEILFVLVSKVTTYYLAQENTLNNSVWMVFLQGYM